MGLRVGIRTCVPLLYNEIGEHILHQEIELLRDMRAQRCIGRNVVRLDRVYFQAKRKPAEGLGQFQCLDQSQAVRAQLLKICESAATAS